MVTETELKQAFERHGLPVTFVSIAKRNLNNFGDYVAIIHLNSIYLNIISDKGRVFIDLKDGKTNNYIPISDRYESAMEVYRRGAWSIDDLIEIICDNWSDFQNH